MVAYFHLTNNHYFLSQKQEAESKFGIDILVQKKNLKIFVIVLFFGTLACLLGRYKTVKIIHIIQIFFNTRSRIYILGTVKPNAIYLSFSNTNQSHDYNL